MGDTVDQRSGSVSSIFAGLRKRPYFILVLLVFTPPFWPILFFFMPVLVAGVVLAAGFVFLDQASQKQELRKEGINVTSDKNANGLAENRGRSSETSEESKKGGAAPVEQPDGKLEQVKRSVATPGMPTTTSPSSVESGSATKQSADTAQTSPLRKLDSSGSKVSEAGAAQTTVSGTPSGQALEKLTPKPAKSETPKADVAPAPMTGPAMLARAAALRKSKLEAAAKSSGEVLFLYGSQTGNAMEVAKSLNAEAATLGIQSRVLALDEKPLHKIPGTTKAAVFVVSSTGDGDPPENCERFHNALKRRTHPPDFLKGLQFTVLGLGDSNYTTYMGVPRVFTSRLPELGAARFYKNCEADEVDGLEEVVDAWKEGLWAALKTVVSADSKRPLLSSAPNGIPPGQEESKLVGVPPLQKSRIKLVWQSGNPSVSAESAAVYGTNGTNGIDGTSGINGINGTSGMNGTNGTSGTNGINGTSGTNGTNAAHPYNAPVTCAKYMTASWSDRRVVHLEVDVSKTGVQYKPGDSLGVLPENRPELIDGLLERLAADGSRVFSVAGVDDVAGVGDVATGTGDVSTGGSRLLGHVGWPCTLRDALLKHCDVTSVARKGLMRVLAEYCADSADQTELLMLSSRGGRDAYKIQIQEARPSLLEILKRFPSCMPDLAHLLDSLPPLVARMYSVTCSPVSVPGKTQVAFSVVREESSNGRVFHGVCTSWLERRLGLDPKTKRQFVPDPSNPLTLPVFLKSGGDFRLPGSLESPLLLIGPGTGVAPFRGFLQERREKIKAEGPGKAGPAWLFFGCRKADEDFLYEEDLRQFATDGTLTEFVTAFSREGQEKVYVQHKFAEHGEQVASLLRHEQGHVFICGDGVNMARDVHAALVRVLIDSAHLTEADANSHLSNMMKDKRYVRDIWS